MVPPGTHRRRWVCTGFLIPGPVHLCESSRALQSARAIVERQYCHVRSCTQNGPVERMRGIECAASICPADAWSWELRGQRLIRCHVGRLDRKNELRWRSLITTCGIPIYAYTSIGLIGLTLELQARPWRRPSIPSSTAYIFLVHGPLDGVWH